MARSAEQRRPIADGTLTSAARATPSHTTATTLYGSFTFPPHHRAAPTRAPCVYTWPPRAHVSVRAVSVPPSPRARTSTLSSALSHARACERALPERALVCGGMEFSTERRERGISVRDIIVASAERVPRGGSDEWRDSLLARKCRGEASRRCLLRSESPLAQPSRNLYSFSFSTRPSSRPPSLLNSSEDCARARARILARDALFAVAEKR